MEKDGLIGSSKDHQKFARLALIDLFTWLKALCNLQALPFKSPGKPEKMVRFIKNSTEFRADSINVDFSLLRRYTDEADHHPEVIFVRTDYFHANHEVDAKDYFTVSTSEPVNYRLKKNEKTEKNLEFFLRNLFDKRDFREGQLDIIINALNRKDTIGLLPTGGGKSLCYQLPCLLQPAISFVVCPIKSLMLDQKANLDNAFITRTHYIIGNLKGDEKEEIQRNFAQGRYFFIWISPERFQSVNFRRYLGDLQQTRPIAYAVIDEVHCMSEWGHDFRTSYLNLTRTIQTYCPTAHFLGLTATASLNVLRDIRIEFARDGKPLADENIKTKLDFTRPELHFDVIADEGEKKQVLEKHLKSLKKQGDFLTPETFNLKAGLLFTPHANGNFGCYSNAKNLNILFQNSANWFAGECPYDTVYEQIPDEEFDNAELFKKRLQDRLGTRMSLEEINRIFFDRKERLNRHVDPGHKKIWLGKLPVFSSDGFEKHKLDVQRDFKESKFPLMVATKAFGMGVDKDNIHYTFHYGLPGSTEALYQEAGRAGRWNTDLPENAGKRAECVVFFSNETLNQERLNELFSPDTQAEKIKHILHEQHDAKAFEGDLFRQLFLMFKDQGTPDQEAAVMNDLINWAFTDNYSSPVTVFFRENEKIKNPPDKPIKLANGVLFGRSDSSLETAIYRLSLLGIVEDWTTDFKTSFQVTFNRFTDESVVEALINHIVKYQTGDRTARRRQALKEEISQSKGDTIPERCIHYLLKWMWENITKTHRQSLKNIWEFCRDFQDSVSFKKQLDDVFKITDFTVVLSHIADNPNQFKEWAKAFEDKSGPMKFDRVEFEARRDNLGRFLESTSNIGFDAISGILRLGLDDYENSDGRERLEKTLGRLKEYFKTAEKQQEVLHSLVQIVQHLDLSEESRYHFADSIKRFYPKSYDWVSDRLNILNVPQLQVFTQRLNQVNHHFHEHLAKIARRTGR